MVTSARSVLVLAGLALFPLSAAATDGTWSRFPPPNPRYGTGAIYDPSGDRLVAFGGWLGAGETGNDIWVLPLSGTPKWTYLDANGPPPHSRSGHTTVYDPVRSRIIVFGGYYVDDIGSTVYLNDVWALSLTGTPSWEELTPSGTPPPPRIEHVAVYDPNGDRILVFGGGNDSNTYLGDTWELSLSGTPTWSEPNTHGAPPARRRSCAVYDPVGSRIILFGGSGGSGVMNDAWTLSLGQNVKWQSFTPTGTPPTAREGQCAVYDPAHERVIVYGGGSIWIAPDTGVWALDLSSTPGWSQRPSSSAPARALHAAILDPVRARMVVFAGIGSKYWNDAWSFDLATDTWSEIPALPGPGNRVLASSFMDSARNRLLVFGGWDGSADRNDLWSHSPSPQDDWIELSPSGTLPPARSSATLVYDPSRDRAVLYGANADVWVLNFSGGEEWVELHPTGPAPPWRIAHSAIYDPVRDRMVIYGGWEGDPNVPPLNDVWELVFTTPPAWNELAPSGSSPVSRFGHTAIYDPPRDRMIVFGGGRGPAFGPSYFNDVWALSLGATPSWSPVAPSGAPPSSRMYHGAFYDPSADRMLVYAGGQAIDLFTLAFGDLWALFLSGGGSWNSLSPDGPLPAARYGNADGFDESHGVLMAFGGSSIANGPRADIWKWSQGNSTGIGDSRPVDPILVRAFPNPVRSSTTIRFRLDRETTVSLSIYDVRGARVAEVLSPASMTAGVHEVSWNAAASGAGNGIYFYRLTAGSTRASGKLIAITR